MMGGQDSRTKDIVNWTFRYNIATEKWHQLEPMHFAIMEGTTCAINEFQLVHAGGVSPSGHCSDLV